MFNINRLRYLFYLMLFISSLMVIIAGRNFQSKSINEDELMILPQTQTVLLSSLGHHEFMAGILWMRSIVYYGDHFLKGKDAIWMGHMLDLITRLDSTFLPAYDLMGSVVETPGSQDLEVLARGTQALPLEWRIRLFYAFRFIEKNKDYARAALVLKYFESDPNPEVPVHIRSLYKTIQNYGMPLEMGIADALQNYMTQGSIFEKRNLSIIARRLFHPNELISARPSEKELAQVSEVIQSCKNQELEPMLCLKKLINLAQIR